MVAKLLSELDVVRTNMDIMNQVLNEVEPGKESADETQLMDVSRITTHVYIQCALGLLSFTGTNLSGF